MIELGREFVEKIIEEQGNQPKNQQYNRQYNYGYNGYGYLNESNSIQFNNYLLEGCPAYERFLNALETVEFESVDEMDSSVGMEVMTNVLEVFVRLDLIQTEEVDRHMDVENILWELLRFRCDIVKEIFI